MNDPYYYLSGIAIVLSIFLLIVGMKAYKKSKIKLLLFLNITFLIILIDSLLALFVGFNIIPVSYSMSDLFLASEIVVMILFYVGVVRGN